MSFLSGRRILYPRSEEHGTEDESLSAHPSHQRLVHMYGYQDA
jgi:hypothetical protein